MTDDQPSEPTLGDLLSAALGEGPVEAPITRAANGCPDALAEMANAAYANAKEQEGRGNCLAALVCFIEALTFSRLAAAHGERDSVARVVFLLDEISSRFRAGDANDLGDSFEAQALVMAELMAEDGDDPMADMVAACAYKIAPAVHAEAIRLRKLVVPA